MSRRDKTLLKLITDQVTINLQMLGAFMKDGISNDMQGCSVITLERNWKLQGKLEITKN